MPEINYELIDAAKKAMQKSIQPLPAPATMEDVTRLQAAIKQAKDAQLPAEVIEKAEKMLLKHEDEFQRLRALTMIQQALYRLDRNQDDYVDRSEWERLKQIFDPSEWEPTVFDELWVKLDRWGKKKLEYEVFADFLLHGEDDVTKLVKDIVFKPPHGTEGLLGIFGPRLLEASTSVDFMIPTVKALDDIDVIGIFFCTVTTIDQTLYPLTLVEETKEKRRDVSRFRNFIRREGEEYESLPKLAKKFEVVVCSFDTTEQGYMKTVGNPPWLVMPHDATWERDHLWRKYNHMLKHHTDTALFIIRPDGSVITKKGLDDINVAPQLEDKLWEKAFLKWCDMLNPPKKELTPPPEEKEEAQPAEDVKGEAADG
mmetsp:Transcript_91855/g.163498  ORF Transcript_91855/g.163498 Transcript_91855/m.163498 type:complete len:370 (-) Transcript_91855:66-1175(-)